MDKEQDKRSVPLKKFQSRRYHQCSIGGCRNLTKDLYSARLRDPYTQTPIYICKYCMEDMLSIRASEVMDMMKDSCVTSFDSDNAELPAALTSTAEVTEVNVNTTVNVSNSIIERNESKTEAIPGVIYEDTADNSLVKGKKRGRKQ